MNIRIDDVERVVFTGVKLLFVAAGIFLTMTAIRNESVAEPFMLAVVIGMPISIPVLYVFSLVDDLFYVQVLLIVIVLVLGYLQWFVLIPAGNRYLGRRRMEQNPDGNDRDA